MLIKRAEPPTSEHRTASQGLGFAKGNVERKVAGLTDKIAGLKSEIEQILMERIHDKSNAERYNKMIDKRELKITQSRERI